MALWKNLEYPPLCKALPPEMPRGIESETLISNLNTKCIEVCESMFYREYELIKNSINQQ